MAQGHRWFAATYDFVTKGTERAVRPLREWIIGEASGRVLELGIGTGASLSHYRRAEQIVGIEPDPYMLRRAEKRLASLGLTNVHLAQAPAEDLPFEDASFDTVVASLVLCTVGDPARSLAEARRVLRPGGELRFLEHVRHDDGWFGRVQDIVAPAWRWFSAGCEPNRRTEQAIASAGFRLDEVRRLMVPVKTPLIAGIARPT